MPLVEEILQGLQLRLSIPTKSEGKLGSSNLASLAHHLGCGVANHEGMLTLNCVCSYETV